MQTKQIGYYAINTGTMDCACKGENLLVMNNPVEMKRFVLKHFKLKQLELRKVYSHEVIQGLKLGGHYLFSEKSYKHFFEECMSEYPQLFPPKRLKVMEPVANLFFYQVSWQNTEYNTPK